MGRYRLLIEYRGTRYSGWQVQQNARSIQGELERAIRAVVRRDSIKLYGSGRTDAGVHALGQVAHVDLDLSFAVETLRRRVNDELPSDINVLDIGPVGQRFHARHAAVARTYLYQIARRRTAFAKPLVWWVREELDVGAMRACVPALLGLRDFAAFAERDDEDERSTLVKLDRVEIGERGDLLLVRIEGSHFLWKMVRRIVGVLVEVGRGGLAPESVTAMVTRKRAPEPARFTAPASGLFLEHVTYPGDERRPGAEPPVNLGRLR